MKKLVIAAAAMMLAAPAFAEEAKPTDQPKLGLECLKVVETITKSEIVKKGKSQSQADVVWRDAFSKNPVPTLIAIDLTPHDLLRSYFDALEMAKADSACDGKEAALDINRDHAIEWLPNLAMSYQMTLGLMGKELPKTQEESLDKEGTQK